MVKSSNEHEFSQKDEQKSTCQNFVKMKHKVFNLPSKHRQQSISRHEIVTKQRLSLQFHKNYPFSRLHLD